LLEVVEEIARMDLEETRQRLPRAAGEMEPRAVLDLGEVGLADAPSELVADGVGDLGLGHLAAETAGGPFEDAQAGHLFSELHGNAQSIAHCDIRQWVVGCCGCLSVQVLAVRIPDGTT